MALEPTVEGNRDRIIAGISQAAARGVRVAVFPENALSGQGNDNPGLLDGAVEEIRAAARHYNIYVLFGGTRSLPKLEKEINWMRVFGPDGRELFQYDKLYDQHDGAMPGVFAIDGIPSSAFLCADRWLRGVEELPIQEGAQISFELSCNFASEWVAPFEWYWYVPRALRNTVWVIFANTGNKPIGSPDTASSAPLRHGHSAIIAPDGGIEAAARDDAETLVVAELDVTRNPCGGSISRGASNPPPFWKAGLKLKNGYSIEAPNATRLNSAETEITIAAAQAVNNSDEMEILIAQAREKEADLVVFPERAASDTALERLQTAARQNRITVVVGMEHRVDGNLRNSAFVIGPDGSVLTRYDQLSATGPYQRGTEPSGMGFMKGVPAVVTVGQTPLTELAELAAAVAGAQIHVHLDHDSAGGAEASLRRLQVWSNLASFQP
jgi:predicted amidohydrolase